MLLKKNNQAPEQVKGIYVNKDARILQKQEIVKTHFNFGHPGESNQPFFNPYRVPTEVFFP